MLAVALARAIPSDGVVELSGTLGAGKTTFVRSLAEGVGVDPRSVSSPSFLTCNEYVASGGDGVSEDVVVVHIDAYMADLADGGSSHAGGGQPGGIDWDAIAHDRSCVVVVEWPARLVGVDWDDRPVVCIELKHTGERSRSATIDCSRVHETTKHRIADAIATMHRETPDVTLNGPFASEREQMADLYKWLSGRYTVSRPLDPDDLDGPV